MTREEIEQLNVVEPYCFETSREEEWYNFGLVQGLEISDANPKSPWISVKKDLPCNHSELINLYKSSEKLTVTEYVVAAIHGYKALSRMYKIDGKWYWETDEPSHWFAIPEPPKE